MSVDAAHDVVKTWKLFVGGAYPRGESGKTVPLHGRDGALIAHLCAASRKDFREAVEAARAAHSSWARATPFLRGQVTYRLAEMLESRAEELAEWCRVSCGLALSAKASRQAVRDAVDTLVSLAGWSDKAAMLLGSQNPVAGPFYNFTAVEPAGVVVAVIDTDAPHALGAACASIGASLAMGAAVIVVVPPEAALPCLVVGEACACSDVPAGAVNVLTADRVDLAGALAKVIAEHRDVRVIQAWCDGGRESQLGKVLEGGAAENLKRVHVRDGAVPAAACRTPAFLSEVCELKTVWMPRAV